MLLQLENTNKENIKKRMDYANALNLNLSFIDDGDDNLTLPGKPLSNNQLKSMIETSRQSGIISMEQAHKIIRNSFNAD